MVLKILELLISPIQSVLQYVTENRTAVTVEDCRMCAIEYGVCEALALQCTVCNRSGAPIAINSAEMMIGNRYSENAELSRDVIIDKIKDGKVMSTSFPINLDAYSSQRCTFLFLCHCKMIASKKCDDFVYSYTDDLPDIRFEMCMGNMRNAPFDYVYPDGAPAISSVVLTFHTTRKTVELYPDVSLCSYTTFACTEHLDSNNTEKG